MIDKVALIYIRNRKVLSTLSKGKDKYYFPGGKREGNESDLETLTREIKEELSVDIVTSSTSLYGIFRAQAHGKNEGVVVQMTCYRAEFTGELKVDHEIEKMVWLTYADKEDTSMVDQIIFDDLKQKGLID